MIDFFSKLLGGESQPKSEEPVILKLHDADGQPDNLDRFIKLTVGDYTYGQFAETTPMRMILQPHPLARFDEARFLFLLMVSSLSIDDKLDILARINTLNQEKIDGLLQVLEEELEKHRRFPPKVWAKLMKLEQERIREWQALELVLGCG